jgi:hypothetical protein
LVDILRKEDGNLLHPILDKLQENVELQYYLKAILDGDQKRFYPGENKLQAQLELLGLIKADEKGYCRIRSLLYQHSLKDFYANMDLVAGQKIQIASGQIEKSANPFLKF